MNSFTKETYSGTAITYYCIYRIDNKNMHLLKVAKNVTVVLTI